MDSVSLENPNTLAGQPPKLTGKRLSTSILQMRTVRLARGQQPVRLVSVNVAADPKTWPIESFTWKSQ